MKKPVGSISMEPASNPDMIMIPSPPIYALSNQEFVLRPFGTMQAGLQDAYDK